MIGTILLTYNQCMAPKRTNSKNGLTFSESGVTTSTQSPSNANSVQAFKDTVYQITTARCASCHGTSQSPLHASSNLQIAHDAIVNNSKIDFNNPENSRMVLKLKNDRHNCWSDCNANATEMLNKINEWKLLMPVAQNTQVTGLTTKDTLSFSQILDPKNQSSQDTIYVMAESGSLKMPMALSTLNNTTFITIPEAGAAAKASTATDSGSASYSIRVNTSDYYKIFLLVAAPDTGSDSIFVKAANSEYKEFHTGVSANFTWKEVKHTTGNIESIFYIPADKEYQLELKQREDGIKISKIAISSDPMFSPMGTEVSNKATISIPISDISKVANSFFEIDVEDFDSFSYKFTNPKIKTPQNLKVKNLKILVNKSFNPQHSTFTIVNKTVTSTDSLLSPYSMIVLKDKGNDADYFSFSFEVLEAE